MNRLKDTIEIVSKIPKPGDLGERRTDQPRDDAPGLGHEAIRDRAFAIYQRRAREGKDGDATSDWMQAERELREESLAERAPERTAISLR